MVGCHVGDLEKPECVSKVAMFVQIEKNKDKGSIEKATEEAPALVQAESANA